MLERRTIQVALIAFLAFSLAHLGYHLTTTDHYSTGDNLGSLGGFVVTLVIAVGLLALTREVNEPSGAPPAYASSPSQSSRS